MKLIMAAATDVGTVREINEDFFYYSKPGRLIVVFDGMGGHQSGAVASRIAGKTMRDVFFHADFAELARLGEDVIDRLPPLALRLVIGARLANRRLLLMAGRERHLQGMGTTLAAIAFGDNNACAVHIGDSRLYCLRAGKLLALTEDHSLVNQLLQDRDIRQDQVKDFRKKNVLTRALGTHPAMKVDAQWFPVQAADTFLLCSDGFHNALADEKISALLKRKDTDMQKMVDTMVQQAKAANGSDNITAVIAKIEKTSGAAEKKDQVKMTIAEETAKIVQFEDKFVHDKYLLEKSGGRRFRNPKFKRSWWPLFTVLSGLVTLAFAYTMVDRLGWFEASSQSGPDNVLMASSGINAATGLLAQNSPMPAISAPPINGYLVFLQAGDSRQLERLRNLSGVRLLDHFRPDKPAPDSSNLSRHFNRPLAAGKYAFVIADSLGNFVYRKDGVHLRALPAIVDTSRRVIETSGAQNLGLAPKEMTASSRNPAANAENKIIDRDTTGVQQ
jgi:protein phosphatase